MYRTENITFETISEDVTRILNERIFNYVELVIDYGSFLKMHISDMDKVKFWLGQLKTWMREDKGIKLLERSIFSKKVWISDELLINAGGWIWDLNKYKGKTGEEIPYKELNLLRQYIDLTEKSIYTDYNITNYFLIDWGYCFNKGYINEIPFEMSWIQRCLYGFQY